MRVPLPPEWQDVSEGEMLRRLAELAGTAGGEGHVLVGREIAGVATCRGCDSALFRLDGDEWAVLHLDWSGIQPPWVEALGHWDDVMPTINAHAAGEH